MERQEQTNSYHQILKYTGLFGSIQGLNILIALVRNKIVAVLLGPSVMGLMSLFSSSLQMLSTATGLGISTSGVKTLSELIEEGDTKRVERHVMVIRSWALLTAIVGFLVCALLGPLLDWISFSWGSHDLHYLLLSPAVAALAVFGGEMAVLKATRQLSSLARISVYNMLFSLVAAFLLFYFVGAAAIVPYLVSISVVQMLTTLVYSYRKFPPRLSLGRAVLREGKQIVTLGLAFVAAGICGTGADFAIRALLNQVASLEAVGLYNSGFTMTMVYAGMVFTAFESDFFPRLSKVNHDTERSNMLVNRQTEVSMHLLSPMLIAFSLGMPFVLPLLFSTKFMPVLAMIQVATLAMFLRGVKLPVAYITLSRGDSRAFFWLEFYSAVVLVGLVVGGYLLFGLTGTGLGILLSELIDLIVVNVYARWKFHYRLSGLVVRSAMLHLPLQVLCLATTQMLSGAAYWCVGLAILAVSMFCSVRSLEVGVKS